MANGKHVLSDEWFPLAETPESLLKTMEAFQNISSHHHDEKQSCISLHQMGFMVVKNKYQEHERFGTLKQSKYRRYHDLTIEKKSIQVNQDKKQVQFSCQEMMQPFLFYFDVKDKLWYADFDTYHNDTQIWILHKIE